MRRNFLTLPFGIPLLLFIGFQGFYWSSQEPAFMNDDSAETIAAGTCLGIQHPPGYALDALWVRLFSLFPLGGGGFRVNLGSGLLAAAGIALLYLGLRRTQDLLLKGSSQNFVLLNSLSSFFAALFLGFSPNYWEKALGAKGGIYLMQEVLLLSLLFLRMGAPDRRKFILACFLSGLGMANHWETQVLFLPLLLLFFWPLHSKDIPVPWDSRVSTDGLVFFFLGLSPLLFLPLRAHLDPIPDLGHPDNLERMFRSLFRTYTFTREPGLLGGFWNWVRGQGSFDLLVSTLKNILKVQLFYLPFHFWKAVGPIGLFLAVLGVVRVWTGPIRGVLAPLLLPLGLLLFVFGLVLWVPLNMPSQWLLDNFLLPADTLLFFLGGLGLGWLGLRIRTVFSAFVACALVLGLILIQGSQAFPKLNEDRQTLHYDYGVNLLRSLPNHALFFAEGDEDYFSFYYLQTVGHLRPDVRMIPTFTLFETWGWDQVDQKTPELGLGPRTEVLNDPYHRIETALDRLVSHNRERIPIGFSFFNGAFHRYYLSRMKDLSFEKSGDLYLFDSPVLRGVALLDPSGLRTRNWNDSPSNAHPSLSGIWGVYRSLGLIP